MRIRPRVQKVLENPRLIARILNRAYHRRLFTRQYNSSGVDIFEQDWDNLFILDACRYDMFQRQNTLPGTLESRHSRGSATLEFLLGNFANQTLTDTVYVTANPQFYRYRDEIGAQFHAVRNVWHDDGWDDEQGTVLPETVVKSAIQAATDFPKKRIIVHFLQPHYPFLESGISLKVGRLGEEDHESPWVRINKGDATVSKERIRKAYEANLERVLPHVAELNSELSGRTVVTSDHGNMLGERSSPLPVIEWGHPPGIYTESLTKIPWHVIETDSSKEIVAEYNDSEQLDPDMDAVKRLRQLGYTE